MFQTVVGLQTRKLFMLPMLALLVAVAAAGTTLSLTQAQSSNGVYDTDGDKLIEINYLEQLFAIRYDLNGDGAADKSSDANFYSIAYPVASGESVCDSDCEGYELTGSLDFRKASSYKTGVINSHWTDTATSDGWLPVFNYGDARSIKGYNAALDGNGNSIANLYSKYTPLDIDTGLFAVLESGATVRHLGLTGVNVIGDYSNTGALVGNNKGLVSGAYSTGSVSGDGNVGGLVGNNRGTVTQSYSSASVSSDENYVGGLVGDNIGTISVSYAEGAVSGKKKYVGGLTGYNLGTVRNSYASGNVSGDSSVGGLVGKNTSDIEYSYAASASVTGGSSIGGLVGSSVDIESEVTDGYWDSAIGPSASSGGVAKTTSELISPTDYSGIYADWDDGDEGEIWDFGTSSQYPALKADLNGDGSATVGEFGSQQVTVSIPTPTPTATPIPDPTATPTPQPLGSLTGVGGGASISGVGGNVSGGSGQGGATGQSSTIFSINLSTATLTVPEGGSASYTVALSHAPDANVTVGLTRQGDREFSTDTTTLTFTPANYSTAQTVTVSAAEDDDRYDNNAATITHTATGGSYLGVTASLSASEDDNDNDGTLVASDATATSVLLTMTGFSGEWWYQRAGWSECQGPVSGSTHRATGLASNASSYINAYHTSSCGPNDGITQGNRFSTLSAPTLVASDVTDSSARLTLSGWEPSKDGVWHYGRTGDWCSGSIHGQNYTDLTGLTRYTIYKFAAYSDAGCHVGVSASMTFGTRQTEVSVSNLNASGDGEGKTFGVASGQTYRLAMAFRTGTHGNGYQLHSVKINIDAYTANLPIRAELYTNTSGSTPNQKQATLSTESPTESPTFTCTPGGGDNCDLRPNTIYQIVFDTTPVSWCVVNCYHNWETTTSSDQTNSPSNAGWTIGNEYARWSTLAQYWTRVYNDDVPRLKINAGMK